MLAEADGQWAHGAEDTVERAMRSAGDLSDMSDPLAWLGRGWPAAVEAARERGHLLRGLALTPEHRVLEVGAGCGAVTRSLAERCGLVDAVELNFDRARLAALRLADCANARVLAGDVSAIPAQPAYDVIVIVGVLEYIGGHAHNGGRVEWLRALRGLLNPGGHLVCAIENRFGVSYLAGAPDDHTGLLFQGIEDHPVDFPARTFARRELEALFTGAGLDPTTLGVFPDYRFPRFVFSNRLLDSPARSLAWQVPRFPTPPHRSHARTAVLDEQRVWRGLVSNGMGIEFANSFLVVAGRDGPQTLWHPPQLATFYTTNRRRSLTTESAVVDRDEGITVSRANLRPGEAKPHPLVQHCERQRYEIGDNLLELLAVAEGAELDRWLTRLREHIESEVAGAGAGPVPFDIWAGNLVVVGENLVNIDREFGHRTFPSDAVLPRALLITGMELARMTPPSRWRGATPRELVTELAERAGLSSIDIDDAVRRQAEIVAIVEAGDPGSGPHATRRDEEIAAFEAGLGVPLRETSVHGEGRDAGPGMSARLRRAQDERDAAINEAAALRLALEQATVDSQAAQQQLRERLMRVEQGLQVVYGSRSWRLTAPLRASARRFRKRRQL
jgi:2-polyprenyl-3-methyl-5-hydroxy-6-metoxy-1,4-benzoquinol methylase